jgi:hypothetical protein
MFPVVDVVDVCTGVAGVVEVEFIMAYSNAK